MKMAIINSIGISTTEIPWNSDVSGAELHGTLVLVALNSNLFHFWWC
jgi:hypothetical protein